MASTHVILLVFAFVCECLAAVGWWWQHTAWPHLVAAGLAFYFASLLF